MICAACDHAMADHIDRCFGGWYCAPPTGGHAPATSTRRCTCPGYTPRTASAEHLAAGQIALYVRAAFVEAFPWLRLPEEAAL